MEMKGDDATMVGGRQGPYVGSKCCRFPRFTEEVCLSLGYFVNPLQVFKASLWWCSLNSNKVLV